MHPNASDSDRPMATSVRGAELDDLKRQLDALAEANVRAAELMAELDEARALTAALERRSEELTFQHDVDLVAARAQSENELAEGLLDVLFSTPGLGLGPAAAVFVRHGGDVVRAAARGDVPASVVGAACEAITRRFDAPSDHAERWLLLPLPSHSGEPLGGLCLATRATPAWRDRWLSVLQSACRGVAATLHRHQLEAERARISRELETARDEALAASHAKSSFLANMSHELRTPLNAILGYSDMLHEDAVDEGNEQLASDLAKISTSGRHLLELINAVLDLSKVEAGKMTLEVRRFDLRAMLDEVATTVRPLMSRQGNELVVSVGDEVLVLEGDEAKLRQCLLNLLSNAAKFTKRGTVAFDVLQGDEAVHFRVSDTGIGMTPEQVATVFEPFTQAETSTTRRYGGTGLGLAITKRFCDLMSATIDVTSHPGEGTTFEIVLPLARG